MPNNYPVYPRPIPGRSTLLAALAIGIVLLLALSQPASADGGRPATSSDPSGVGAITAIVAEIVQVFGGLAGVYLTGTIVLSLAQANIEAAAGGRPGVLADAQMRILPAVISFVVAVSANVLSQQVPVQPAGGGGMDASSVVALWKAIAAFVINIVLFSAGAVVAVGFATGGLAAQVAVFTGQPGALSQGWIRVLLVAVTGVLTLASVQIANWIVGAVI